MEISIPDATHARVKAPAFVSLSTIEQFVISKSRWIHHRFEERKKTAAALQAKKYAHGYEFLFLGQSYPLHMELHPIAKPQFTFQDNRWVLATPEPLAENAVKEYVLAWYRQEAGEIFASRIFHYSRLMGQAPLKITVKTQKRLWGSCNPKGQSINLNWLLAMAPLAVIDYVIVHELSHLKIPNHSKRFWNYVQEFSPDYQSHHQWLKTNHHRMLLP